MTGAPSKLRFTRKAEASTMIFPTLDLRNPEKAARRRWKYEAQKICIASSGGCGPLPFRSALSQIFFALKDDP